MSIAADARCIQCFLDRNMEFARTQGDEAQATRFCKAMLQMFLDAPEDISAPWYAPHTARLLQEIYGLDLDRYRPEKEASNAFVLARLEQLRAGIEGAADPLLVGLQYAILGNYIDFAALQEEVNFEKLDAMLAQARQIVLPAENVAAFRRDLARGKKLLYITDNAGEIGFDRVFAEKLARLYPHLEITFLVRGGPALNDATEEDARQVGVPFPVIGNGNLVSGTQLDQLSPAAEEALYGADVIISKGQGNVETLYGCGLNIYYAFLIKCHRFTQLFGQPRLTPMFMREKK
ncbi:MAG: DUF89 family protein [Ruminococcaceae bacterium]|nr:DUF89 family protein [Oscillospiraceae bacterium]